MTNKKRRRISKQGMQMIENVIKNKDQEFALEHRIEDQLRYNLGEEYFRRTRRRDDDDRDYFVNSPIE